MGKHFIQGEKAIFSVAKETRAGASQSGNYYLNSTEQDIGHDIRE